MHAFCMAQPAVMALLLTALLTLLPAVYGDENVMTKDSGPLLYNRPWTPMRSEHIFRSGFNYLAEVAAAEYMNETCMNGGEMDPDGSCKCPNPHDFAGLRCGLCQRDDVCSASSGTPSECYHGLAIRGTNKQLQCSLDSPFLALLGDGRDIQAFVTLNFTTADNTLFAQNDSGICAVTLYRIEPHYEYVDPFFRCNMSQCSMRLLSETNNDGGNNATTLHRAFKTVTLTGQIVLVSLCVLLALLRCVSSKLGQQRMAKIVIILGSTLIVATLLFIGLMLVLMRPTSKEDKVVYECAHTECHCAEDPPAKYTPICSKSLISKILTDIKNDVRYVCNLRTGLCQLTLTDVALVFNLKCNASECVNTKMFPNVPAVEEVDITYVQRNLLLIFLLLVVLIIVVISLHAAFLFSRSKRWTADFIRMFGLLELRRQSEISLSLDEVDDKNRDSDEEDVLLWKQQQTEALLANGIENTVSQGNNNVDRSVLPNRLGELQPTSDMSSSSLNITPCESDEVEFYRRIVSSSFELQLKNLRYCLPGACSFRRGEAVTRVILDGVTFTVRSGDVLAILGPSGAGKTSLLDILSARRKQGQTSGTMSFNGTEVGISSKSLKQYRNIIGYVSQEDTLLPALTVEQTIEYAARLKLPHVFSNRTINNIVHHMIEALKLQQCRHTLIGGGSGLCGVSGGEKRRVSIAVELLANPRILFLDEPTSGLDAVSAKRVIEAVVELAKKSPMQEYAPYFFAFKPIVIFSIHQPSQEIFELFDKILLLSRGVSLYCGAAREAAEVLESRVGRVIGSLRVIPRRIDHPNHAEYLMKLEEILDDDARFDIQAEEILPMSITHEGTELFQEVGVERDDSFVSGNAILHTTTAFRRYYANLYQQIALLTSRAASCLFSSFHLLVCHAAVTAFVGVLMIVLYREQSLDLSGALNRAGSITFMLLVLSLVSLSCLGQLVAEHKLFVLERENGFYRVMPYLISKVFVDIIPLRVVPALVLASLIYFPMGLRVDGGMHFLWFILIVVLFSVCVTLLVLCIGIITGAFGTAALISSVVILWNFVFGGFLVQSDTVPLILQPFQMASPFFLAFEALLVNELNGQTCSFAPTDETGKPASTSIPIMCVQYLWNIGLKPNRFNTDVALLATLTIILLAVAWILLKFTTINR